jgi:regulatory protein
MLRSRRVADYSGDPLDIRRAAMDLLSRREYGVEELRTRLVARFGSDAPVAEELQRLAADGLLSDQRFSESFVRMHRNKGHGPVRILHELRMRGIGEELAVAVVEPSSPDWAVLAREWRQRRFGVDTPASSVEWQKQARHLQQRGFSSEQLRFALKQGDID